jgi:hypothetical protein
LSSGDCRKTSSLEINVGRDGPYISASNSPTFFPYFFIKNTFCRENAKFMAIVLFPTPPLQLETAIIFFTLDNPPFFINLFSFSLINKRYLGCNFNIYFCNPWNVG